MARILVGVSGGIAAYKAVELVRLATGAGHAVRVVQTQNSLRFVGRATFEGVTGAPVLVDEFERDPARGAFPGDPSPGHDPISHLELVRRCDVYCIAPASANTVGKLAHGLADNLLTGAALACTAPLIVAPAMNNHMYDHPATRENLDLLRRRGVRVVDPERGRLASMGEWGTGRLPEPQALLAAIEEELRGGSGPRFVPRSLDGLRVLVSAGGTREPIDSVRYVGNRSSGRMGLALAEEAARRGADVTLVNANVSLAAPPGVKVIEVGTAAELLSAAGEAFDRADVLLMAAAVADFRPASTLEDKIRRSGRAAEHGAGAERRAREKLRRKGLDAVVVNDISRGDIGFDVDHNEVTVLTASGERRVERASKPAVAAAILDEVERLRATTGPASTVEGES